MDIVLLKFDHVESTNATARALIADGTITGPSCVLAREQTGGRGTYGRQWASPRDAGIYASVVDPRCAGARVPHGALSVAAARACCAVLHERTGLAVDIAGVNDLIINDCKLGGILVETTIENGRIGPMIIGIGINTTECARLIDDAKRPPCSLESSMAAAAYAEIDVPELVMALAARVCHVVADTVKGPIEEH